MSHHSNYQQAPGVYPPPPTSYPPPEEVYPPRTQQTYPEKVQGYQQGPFVAPPPVGYPMKNDPGHQHQQQPAKTKHRGGGFRRGCCAGLCCFCCLDMCF